MKKENLYCYILCHTICHWYGGNIIIGIIFFYLLLETLICSLSLLKIIELLVDYLLENVLMLFFSFSVLFFFVFLLAFLTRKFSTVRIYFETKLIFF